MKDSNNRYITSHVTIRGINEYKFFLKETENSTSNLYTIDVIMAPMVSMEILQYPDIYPATGYGQYEYLIYHEEVANPDLESEIDENTFMEPVNKLTSSDISFSPQHIDFEFDDDDIKYIYELYEDEMLYMAKVTVTQSGNISAYGDYVYMTAQTDDNWVKDVTSKISKMYISEVVVQNTALSGYRELYKMSYEN